jgi:hypothetical protein
LPEHLPEKSITAGPFLFLSLANHDDWSR